MKEYLTCEVAFSYGISLRKARRFSEEEKEKYAEWFRDKGFVCLKSSFNIDLEHITWEDVREVLNNRDDDGSFSGCSNVAYIISQNEWDELVELNTKKGLEKEKKEVEKSITECKQIIEKCEKQEKMYTKEEAAKKRRDYNRLYNEGGEGYVPHFYTIEEYEFAKTKLNELLSK